MRRGPAERPLYPRKRTLPAKSSIAPQKQTLARGPQMLAMAGRSSGAHPARDHVSKLPAPPFLALIATDHLRSLQVRIGCLPARRVLPLGVGHHHRVAAIGRPKEKPRRSGRDAVPLAVERRYYFPEFRGYLGNAGSMKWRSQHGSTFPKWSTPR